MKTQSFLLVLIAILLTNFATTTTVAQQKITKEEEAIKECLLNYADGVTLGDTIRQAIAFHPTASMKFIDTKNKEFKDVPIKEFLNRLKKEAGKKVNRKTTIRYIYLNGTAAQASLEIEGDTYVFYDYMNLLKIDNEWKIVSKIFYRKDKAMP